MLPSGSPTICCTLPWTLNSKRQTSDATISKQPFCTIPLDKQARKRIVLTYTYAVHDKAKLPHPTICLYGSDIDSRGPWRHGHTDDHIQGVSQGHNNFFKASTTALLNSGRSLLRSFFASAVLSFVGAVPMP